MRRARLPVAGEQSAEESFAGRTHQHGNARVDETIESAEQRPVVLRVLGEAEPRIEDDAGTVHPGGDGRVDLAEQSAAHVLDDVAVVVLLRGTRSVGPVDGGTPVHEHPGDAGIGDDTRHVGIGAATGDVVDDGHARTDRRSRHGCPHRVDADAHAVRDQLGDHRCDALRLDGRVDAVGSRTCRLAPHIDDVDTRGVQFEAVPHRGVDVQVAAAVRERVGRDVDDAHHHGPVRVRKREHERRLFAKDEIQRLGPGHRAGLEHTAHGGGGGAGARLTDSPHRHAEVLGLHDHDDSARFELAHHRVGDLRGETLLHLRPLRVQVDDPRQLRQARHPARLARDVADVRDAVEGHQVVLARRVHRDVSHEDELAVRLVERRSQHLVGIDEQSAEHLPVCTRHSSGRVLQPLALGVLTHREQQLANGRLGALLIERPTGHHGHGLVDRLIGLVDGHGRSLR